MGKSDDRNDRETYDPFKKPEDNGAAPGRGAGGGFGYPGGDNGGFGYPGGGNRDGYGYPGGNGGNAQSGGNGAQNGSFYGPDYFANGSGYGYAQGPAGGNGYAQGTPGYAYQPVPRTPGYRYSVVSAIFGGIALAFCLSLWIPLITGVLAIVFALIGRHRDGKFTVASRTGLILGIVALVIVALLLTYLILHFEEVMQLVEEWIKENAPDTPNGGGNGGTTTPDTSGGGGRQLTLLPKWRIR